MFTDTNEVLSVATKYVKETPTIKLKFLKSEANCTKFSAASLSREPDIIY
jgi:hypothetical protein